MQIMFIYDYRLSLSQFKSNLITRKLCFNKEIFLSFIMLKFYHYIVKYCSVSRYVTGISFRIVEECENLCHLHREYVISSSESLVDIRNVSLH